MFVHRGSVNFRWEQFPVKDHIEMIAPSTFSESEKKVLLDKKAEIVQALRDNCLPFPQYPGVPLLKAGDIYHGIWLEHNQDNLFFADYNQESAWASQDVFMRYQRKDGLLPFAFFLNDQNAENSVCYQHVQSVWPFARSAIEIARKTNRPESDFERIYQAGARYDEWFANYRNRAGTGLAEMYCEYDTGHDNDPRVTDDGIPHSCPGNDAVNMPDLPIMPVLSVDLSAMLYGARIALSELSELLGKKREAAKWRNKAETLRLAIRNYLYDPADGFYYDRDTRGFRKYRTEHVTRLFLNRVLDREEFDSVYDRHFSTPGKEFNPAFPIPSVSIDDPNFDRRCPKNSWGSNTQAPTTLRAILWMDHYNRSDDLTGLLSRWLRAICDHPETTFQQEINPFTGAPVGEGVNFTPTLLVFLEAIKRLGWTICKEQPK